MGVELFLRGVEAVVVLAAVALIVVLGKGGRRAELAVFCGAVVTTTFGEYVNEFVTTVAVYPAAYLLRIPGTGIPLFIIAGGASLSAGLLWLVRWIIRRFPLPAGTWCGPLVVAAASIFLPLLEVCGIEVGLWRWTRPFSYSPGWFLGVWKFYFLFVVLPAFAAVCVDCAAVFMRRES